MVALERAVEAAKGGEAAARAARAAVTPAAVASAAAVAAGDRDGTQPVRARTRPTSCPRSGARGTATARIPPATISMMAAAEAEAAATASAGAAVGGGWAAGGAGDNGRGVVSRELTGSSLAALPSRRSA